MFSQSSAGVDDPDDFGDGGDVVGHQIQAFVEEGAHALADGHAADLFLGRPSDDKAFNFGGNPQKFVYADAFLVAGTGAEVATLTDEELVLVGAVGLEV